MARRPYVVCSGGGTGGHLAPGLSVLRALEHRWDELDARFLIVGREVERRFLEKTPWSVRRVVTARTPKRRWTMPLTMTIILSGTIQCIAMYLVRRPTVVIGLGGYGSIPGILAARALGVPIVQIEVNRHPGAAVRKLSRFAKVTFTAFEDTGEKLRGRADCVGVPLREGFEPVDRAEARRRFDLDPDRITVTVVGGSQGARCLNRAMTAIADRLAEWDVQVLHQVGAAEADAVRRRYDEAGVAGRVEAFVDDMAAAWSAADVIVARAGASTVAEIAVVGRAAVFVPFESAAESHQLFNVKRLADEGAAEVLTEAEAGGERFAEVLDALIHDEARRRSMAEAIAKQGNPNAAATIAAKIDGLLPRGLPQ